jgi:hypothetical protein
MLIDTKPKPDALMPVVVEVMSELLERHGEISPLEVLLALEMVDPDVVENWQKGALPYLERGITVGLTRVTRVLHLVHEHANVLELKTVPGKYSRKGKGPKHKLRFSKRGDTESERLYASHFVRKE